MAIDKGETTLTVRTSERTWRVEIETARGQVPTITAHRETIRVAGEDLISRETGIVVRRSLDELEQSKDSVTAYGITVTALQMAALVAAFVDQWREQDLAAADAAAGRAPPPLPAAAKAKGAK